MLQEKTFETSKKLIFRVYKKPAINQEEKYKQPNRKKNGKGQNRQFTDKEMETANKHVKDAQFPSHQRRQV